MIMQMHPEQLVFMGRAQDHICAGGNLEQARLQLIFPGDQQAVRGALTKAMNFLRGLDFGQEECGPVELVLAEAINNVVKHAYAGQSHGVVELAIEQTGDRLAFTILDDGLPMPDDEAPAGPAHDLDCAMEDLPEGGFGWFLIRDLTHDLLYRRVGNRNRLEFMMRLGAGTQPQ